MGVEMPGEREVVRELEGIAARAWPAAVIEPLDGWLLRFSDGVTRRANSVWPNGAEGRLDLAEKLAMVEDFYSRRNQPVRYQISPATEPPALDAILEDHGYRYVDPTLVTAATLAEVLSRSERSGPVALVDERLSESWLTAYCQSEGVRPGEAVARRAILERRTSPGGHAVIALDGQAAAVGLGIGEGDWLGVFCMVTHQTYRRRGLATAVLRALAGWGKERGHSRVYLQVMQDNEGARALYGGMGFTTLYGYHYRELHGGRQ
jgi:GNAT superfamily N-acetyltransferase